MSVAVAAVSLTGHSTIDFHHPPGPTPMVARSEPASPQIRARATLLRPPQFLVVSFDGGGGVRLWPYWRRVARRAGAHFTFFVSGVYLLDGARRDLYRPPRHRPGASDIGFALREGGITASASVRGVLEQIAVAFTEGNEIGTHFNGHFCSPYAGNVGEWSASDWSSELAQFGKLLFSASSNNRLKPAVPLPFGPEEVVGARTPCLEGKPDVLLPVLAAHGFRYDASQVAELGVWPHRAHGVWELPLQLIPFVGHTFRVVSMDYNFLANQAPLGMGQDTIERETYVSLWRSFEASYLGNRAPLSFANHFETWQGGAYNRALTRVVLRACRLPEVRCASFRELVDWLDSQPPRRLRRYRQGRFPKLRDPVRSTAAAPQVHRDP